MMVPAMQNLWSHSQAISIYQGSNSSIFSIDKFKQRNYNVNYSHFKIEEDS